MANYKYSYRYNETSDINISSSNVLWASLNYTPLANKQITAIRTKDHTATSIKFVVLDDTYEVLWVSNPVTPVNGIYEITNLNIKFSKDFLLGIVFQGGYLRGKAKTGTLGILNYTSLTYTTVTVGSKFTSYSGTSGNEMLYEIDYVDYSNKFLISSESGKGVSVFIGGYTENLIPKMTSLTAPSGIVTASSGITGGNSAWTAFDKSLNNTDRWIASGTSGWIAYEFSVPVRVDMYSIQSTSQTGSGILEQEAKDWKFEGSNDGIVWSVLDTRSNVTDWTTGGKKDFKFNNSMPYKKYRINITANNGSTFITVSELLMYSSISTVLKTVVIDEANFISHGMDKNNLIDLYSKVDVHSLISKSMESIGSGKVFKQKIDTTKIPIKKASIT
ncbi:discoidin domain-containing protein [Paenibacillus sp. OVF10]|nr:discoidin domain-containing protein [Paenibacillus sp. OVF10]